MHNPNCSMALPSGATTARTHKLAYTLFAWTAAIIVGAIAILLSFAPSRADSIKKNLDLCNSNVPAQRIEACSVLIDSGVLSGSTLGDAFYNRGRGFFEMRDYVTAITDFDVTLQLNPKDVDAYIFRGNAKVEVGRHDDAIGDYSQAISLVPTNGLAYHNRGVAHEQKAITYGSVTDDTFLRRVELAIADHRKAFSLRYTASYHDLVRLGATSTIEQKDETFDPYACVVDDECGKLCNRTCGSRGIRNCTYANRCSGSCTVWCR